MQTSGMESYFHATRTADKTLSKPNPAMLLEIMDELGVVARRALMVGDTTHDLQMAHNAGVDAIGMTHGAHPADQLRELNPLMLANNFFELQVWLKERC